MEKVWVFKRPGYYPSLMENVLGGRKKDYLGRCSQMGEDLILDDRSEEKIMG